MRQGTLSYSETGLPAGLSMASATGLISGTIGAWADWSSPYTVTVTATDGTASASETLNWTVSHVSLTNPGPQTGADGVAVSLALQGRDADGDSVMFSANGLPSGLSINGTTGVISGTVARRPIRADPTA